MSLENQVVRVAQGSKSALKALINKLGGQITDETIDQYADLVDDLEIDINADGANYIIEQNAGLIQKFWRGTQAEYNAIETKDDSTMYIITDGNGGVVGSGDMSAEIYDPQGKATDIFAYIDAHSANIPITSEIPEDADIWFDPEDEPEEIPGVIGGGLVISEERPEGAVAWIDPLREVLNYVDPESGEVVTLGTPKPLASIFVKGLSESDSAKAVQQVPGKVLNPEWRGLPEGYTQLEYIESKGTQYIDTLYKIDKPTKVKYKYNPSSVSGDIKMFGDWYDGSSATYHFVGSYNEEFKLWNYGDFGSQTTCSANTEYEIEAFWGSDSYYCRVNGIDVVSGSKVGTFNGTYNAFVFAGSNKGNPISYTSAKLYYFQIENEDGIVRNYIPTKRNSDNAVGLYDLVTNEFYTNAGTGEFVDGEETPQYVDGIVDGKTKIGVWNAAENWFEITKIKDLNTTWVVTSMSDEFVVDISEVSITEGVTYDIVVNGINDDQKYLMLYDYGDECKDVTGGWVTDGYSGGKTDGVTWNMHKATLNVDHIRTEGGYSGTTYYIRGLGTNNPINSADYTAVFAFAKNITSDGNWAHMNIYSNGKGPFAAVADRTLTMMRFNNTGTQWMFTNCPNDGTTDIVQKEWTDEVTNLPDSIHVAVAAEFRSARAADWYAIFLTKEDKWDVLCMTGNIEIPTNVISLVQNTDAMTTVLSSESLVRYMTRYCTGSFMAHAIQSETFLTALEASPYKDIVYNNEHWAKFLAMVQN